VVVGATFIPGSLESYDSVVWALSQALQPSFPLILRAENLRLVWGGVFGKEFPIVGDPGEDSRLSSWNLNSLRGRGQNCFVKLENLNWGAPNLFPGFIQI
jgi:hypothetical protein